MGLGVRRDDAEAVDRSQCTDSDGAWCASYRLRVIARSLKVSRGSKAVRVLSVGIDMWSVIAVV